MEVDPNVMAGLTIAIGGMVPAFGIAWIASNAMKAIGRNPESADKLQSLLILVAAFVEAIAVYSLVVALAIKFV